MRLFMRVFKLNVMTNSDYTFVQTTYKNQRAIQPTFKNQKTTSIVKKINIKCSSFISKNK